MSNVPPKPLPLQHTHTQKDINIGPFTLMIQGLFFFSWLVSSSSTAKMYLRDSILNLMSCHTEIEATDQTLILSWYSDTGQTSPGSEPILLGVWQVSHQHAKFLVSGLIELGFKSQTSCTEDPHCLFVGCLLNVPATYECISGTDLLRQFYVLPHWDRSSRSNFPSHPVTVY